MVRKTKKDEKPIPVTDDIFDPLLVESRQVATAILLFDSAEETVVTKASEAVFNFLIKGDINKKMVLEFNIFPPIFKLLQHEDRGIRRNATMVIGALAAYPPARKLLKARDDTIPMMVRFILDDEPSITHEYATMCLKSLSGEYYGKMKVYEAGGLSALFSCLDKTTDPDVQKHCLETIGLLLDDFPVRSALKHVNGVENLLKFINSEFPIIQQHTLVALQKAMQDDGNRASLRQAKGMQQLISFIGRPEVNDMHTYAVQVLANCMEDPQCLQQISEDSGLQRLLAFMTDTPQPVQKEQGRMTVSRKSPRGKSPRSKGKKGTKTATPQETEEEKRNKSKTPGVVVHSLMAVKEQAAKAITRAARREENRRILHLMEADTKLVLLLTHENSDVVSAACLALAALAEHPGVQDAVGKTDGLEQLLRLIRTDSVPLRAAVTLALVNLTHCNVTNCREIGRLKGVEAVFALLSDRDDEIKANAINIVTSLCMDDQLRIQLQDRGTIQKLIELTRSPEATIQRQAASALATLITSHEARYKFSNAGGVTYLLDLLSSPNPEVRQCVCAAIAVCAAEDFIAQEFIRAGALQQLNAALHSTNRYTNSAKSALDKLLESDLSAKYAITDYLSPTNIITDGFYDSGRLRHGQSLLPLGELVQLSVDNKLPILVVETRIKPIVPTLEEPIEGIMAPSANLETTGSKKSKTRTPRRRSRSKSNSRERIDTKEVETPIGSVDVTSQKVKDRNSSAGTVSIAWQGAQIFDCDASLVQYIEEVKETIMSLVTMKAQAIALAEFVARQLGGPIEIGLLGDFLWELQAAQLKVELNSNVIPIGKMRAGIHPQRALLFKVLADRIALPCSLVRSDYNRVWNEIWLPESDDVTCSCFGSERTSPTYKS